MKINMTIDECIEFAREWSRGMTIHEGSQGWRVVCMLLADEVVRLRSGVKIPDGWKLVPVEPTDDMALAAIKVTLRNPSVNGVQQYKAMLSAAPEYEVTK